MANCVLCNLFRTPADTLGRSIYAIHLRTEHPDFQGGLPDRLRVR